MLRILVRCGLTVLAGNLLLLEDAGAFQNASATPVFERDIRPIFEARCFGCHGNDRPASGLDLRTEAAVLKGSAQGPVVIKGSAETSPLAQRVANGSMPPKGAGEPLRGAEVELIRKWIDRGTALEAGSPAPALAVAVASAASARVGSVADKDREFWAFRKPMKAPVPRVKNAARVRTPIDSFLLAKLEAKGLSFSTDASKLTLMRRAYYDLIGMPPSIEEQRQFLTDGKPGAYERLVDRLLASPQYGERWGRHWLDVAGYNDEQGFANDLAILVLNDGIWRYRDYVIRAFNDDMPYNQFLTEQLAGDEMVDWKGAKVYTPEIKQKLAATGYLRLMQDLTDSSEVNLPPYYFDVLTRLVDNFASGVLGLTGQCARCHNHKYDPISQRDYYSMAAVFATGYNPEQWKQPKDRYLPDVSPAELEQINKFNEEIDRPVAQMAKQLAGMRQPYEQKLFEGKLAAAVPPSLREDVRTAFSAAPASRNAVQNYLYRKLKPELEVPDEEVARMMTESERATSEKLKQKIATMQSWRRTHGKIQALWNMGEPPKIHVLRRGMFETPGEEVKPGFFAVLSPPNGALAKPAPDARGGAAGFRLALAHWAATPENPLTARVIVNRIWLEHFGKGIVATPENFGKMGAAPANQELLDWLAADFVENGWKMKRLHKMILTSTGYRQSSRRSSEESSPKGEEVDPGNDLLWRANLRRVDAESLRDSVLAVSGKLDSTMFGPPVALDSTKDGLVTVAEKLPEHPKYEISAGRFRRSVYLLARRNYSTSMLDVFDFPVVAINCTRRVNSATPLQSLTLLNSEFLMERAEDFAARVEQLAGSGGSMEKQIGLVFELALARQPSTAEAGLASEHVEKQRQRYLALKAPPPEASRKALASVCQMLMAGNEFLYVD